MTSQPEIETERLVLRRPRLRDGPRIASLLNNYQVTKNLARVPYPYTLNMALDWLLRQKRDWTPETITFAVCEKKGGLIGFCGTHREGQFTEIGYWLGQPYWNRGYMSEALKAVLEWYFANSQSDTLISGVFYFNTASLAVQKKFGFVETGIGKRICLAQSAEIDHIETQLTRSDFFRATRTQ
ncbi:GNAT family N-acetyltransferase [Pelagibacterium lentulum]|uniref:N-acetyltransferase n=1 Tax=Pelagibacterium lentulum TaxID=2029865 RepID=A0A916VUS0_9HYPH|nr:GNAT family N-acetyltransferase [Pelagibacterium lentulum]GGA36732.1 N-acetyltransferase [Pelagibacterium lentulum]